MHNLHYYIKQKICLSVHPSMCTMYLHKSIFHNYLAQASCAALSAPRVLPPSPSPLVRALQGQTWVSLSEEELSKAWILHIFHIAGQNKPCSRILVENHPFGYHLPEALLLGGSEHHFKGHQYVFLNSKNLKINKDLQNVLSILLDYNQILKKRLSLLMIFRNFRLTFCHQ